MWINLAPKLMSFLIIKVPKTSKQSKNITTTKTKQNKTKKEAQLYTLSWSNPARKKQSNKNLFYLFIISETVLPLH